MFLLLAFCLFASRLNNDERANWTPFILSGNLNLHSPINMGKFILDPPAGKHGFVKVKDGRFYFEDGTRAKFWGTNISFSSCFPSKKQTEIMVNRLVFFGFNAVRLHHMDCHFEPNGIFEDTSSDCSGQQLKRTGKLSKKQLDRLDYLIYKLKLQGIYVDMNLLVSRHFTEADGVIEASELGLAAKPISMFDPKLIELQKQYAKDLLTHYNPYTRLRYCDDPAIAMIEITNENSIFNITKKRVPEYYLKQLETKWENWREPKDSTIENTKKAFYIDLEKSYFTEMSDFLHKECYVKVPITGIGGFLYLENIDTQEPCDFIDIHFYWDHPVFPNKSWDGNDFRIHNKSILRDANLGSLGEVAAYFPASRTKPFTVSEWGHCYPNEYAYEMPILIAVEAKKNDWDALYQFAFAGFPFVTDNIINFFDTISNPQQLILCSLGSFLYNKSPDVETIIDGGILKVDSALIKGMVGSIKNKPIDLGPLSVISKENGAVFIFSPQMIPIEKAERLILIKLSSIKNRKSRWISKKRFLWGTSPTLLKNMDVEISSNGKKGFEIFGINEKGTPTTSSAGKPKVPWLEIVIK